MRNAHLQAVVVLTAAAAVLRFWSLGTQSYWYDEAITVDLVRRSFHGMLAAIPHTESTPPLYYVLAWGWSRLFGTTEAGLRSLSAIFGTATIPAAYAAGRTFVSRRSSLFAAALVAVSPFLVSYSQEARSYALLVLLGALSLMFLRQAVKRDATPPLVWWAITSALAVATHYFAAFLVVAEAAWLLFRCANRRAAVRAVAAVCVVSAALLPLAVYQARYKHTFWISSSSVVGRAEYFLHQLVVGAYPASSIRPIIVAIPVVVLVGLVGWTEQSERRGALLAAAFGLFAAGAPFLLALASDPLFGGHTDYFLYRNVIGATVPLTIAAGTVAGTARAGKAGTIAIVVACSLLLIVTIDISRRPDLQKADYRGVAASLRADSAVRAIVLDPRTGVVLGVYLPQLRKIAAEGERVREIDLIPEPRNPIAGSLPPGFHRFETDHVRAYTIYRLRASRPLVVKSTSLVHELPGAREVNVLIYAPNR